VQWQCRLHQQRLSDEFTRRLLHARLLLGELPDRRELLLDVLQRRTVLHVELRESRSRAGDVPVRLRLREELHHRLVAGNVLPVLSRDRVSVECADLSERLLLRRPEVQVLHRRTGLHQRRGVRR
jgi:hypothetical protein